MSNPAASLGPDAPELSHLAAFEGKVKGALMRSVLDNYEHRHPGCLVQLKDHLAPAFASQWDEGIVVSAWYPEVFFVALLRAIDRTVGLPGADEEIANARTVFQDVARVYHKVFLKVMGAERVLKMFQSSGWRLYHTHGEFIVDEIDGSTAKVRLVGNPAVLERPYSEGTVGGLLGALELAGARETSARLERAQPDTLKVELSWH